MSEITDPSKTSRPILGPKSPDTIRHFVEEFRSRHLSGATQELATIRRDPEIWGDSIIAEFVGRYRIYGAVPATLVVARPVPGSEGMGETRTYFLCLITGGNTIVASNWLRTGAGHLEGTVAYDIWLRKTAIDADCYVQFVNDGGELYLAHHITEGED